MLGWGILDKFNAITSAIMFILSIINLIISWKINSKINSAVDLQRLKDSKDEVTGNIEAIIRVLNVESKISDESKSRIQFFLTDLRATYPDIKRLNQKKLLKIIESENVDFLKVREMLRRLITEIERIV